MLGPKRLLIGLALICAASAWAEQSADSDVDAQRMAQAREQLYAGHGGQVNYLAMLDRMEWQRVDGQSSGIWDFQGWLGGDINRLWVKSEGETESGSIDDAELQLLYGRAVSPFFDLQLGIRHDLEPQGLNHGVVALQGLAPQWFEADFSGFLSERGDLTGRVELEYDALLTQRLVLQPRFEFGWSAQDIPELALGRGMTVGTFGLRLRYEIIREFAPYVGVEWRSAFGGTADRQRAAGESVTNALVVAGFRLWY